MIIIALLFLLGVSGTLLLKTLPSAVWFFPLSLISIFFFFWLRKKWVIYMLILLFGFFWTVFFAQLRLNWMLPEKIENQPVWGIGYIASLPEENHRRVKFDFKLKELNGNPLNILSRVSWYGNHPKIVVGKKWRLKLKLKRPHSTLNFGSFDQEKYFFQKNIRAVGFVVKDRENSALKGFLLSQTPNYLRQYLLDNMYKSIKDYQFFGVLSALTIGFRADVPPSQWEIFRITGTSHLMAISGLHIGLISGFFYYFIQFLWGRFYFLNIKFPAKKAAAIGGLVSAIFYCFLSGFSLPAQRALIMIFFFSFSFLCGRYSNPWNVFSSALVIILFLNPLSILSNGFWLSFFAVFLILYLVMFRISLKGFWNKWGRVQFGLTVSLIPLSLIFFQKIPVFSFFSNFLTVPFVSFFIIPLSLFSAFVMLFSSGLGAFVFLIPDKLLGFIFLFLHWISEQKFSLLNYAIPDIKLFCIMLAGVFFVFLPYGFPSRFLGLITFLPFFHSENHLENKQILFTLLDVGQGLSSIIMTKNHTLVFDTGAKLGGRLDMGNAVVLPYLRKKNIHHVDKLLISHADNDHIGGAKSILNETPVETILTSTPNYFYRHKVNKCYKGQSWKWDGVLFKVLYPLKGSPYLGNDSSCVLKIQVGNYGILVTGDLEKKGEKHLVEHEKNHLFSTILVAGHHGSKTSSSIDFIKAVNPSYVLFSSGYLNQYHFPHPSVVNRYLSQGIPFENTAEAGSITFKLDSKKGILEKVRYRDKYRKYWNIP